MKWNEKLFHEMYQAYRCGRAEKDPSEGWYKGEIGFFDFYVIPLTQKLKECGVFGVSCDEYFNYAKANRDEWEQKGEDIVQQYLTKYHKEHAKYEKQAGAEGQSVDGDGNPAAVSIENLPPLGGAMEDGEEMSAVPSAKEDAMDQQPPMDNQQNEYQEDSPFKPLTQPYDNPEYSGYDPQYQNGPPAYQDGPPMYDEQYQQQYQQPPGMDPNYLSEHQYPPPYNHDPYQQPPPQYHDYQDRPVEVINTSGME